MRERLIEILSKTIYPKEGVDPAEVVADYLLDNGVFLADINKVSPKYLPLITHIAGYPIDEVINLMEAKNAGRVVVLPCAVGDTVYAFCETFGAILPYFVETLSCAYYDKNKVIWQYEANCTNPEESELLDSIDFEFEEIGKTVFLTKEEAEKALAERSEGK